VPHGLLMVPTMTAATSLLVGTGTRSASDVLLASLGFFGSCFPLVIVAVFSMTSGCFRATAFRVAVTRSRFAIPRFLHCWYDPTTEYADAEGAEGFTLRWEFSGILDYAKRRQWFGLLEAMLGMATSLLAGIAAAREKSWCVSLNAVETALTVLFLISILALNPHTSKADRWLGIIGAMLQCGTAVLGLAGRDESLTLMMVQVFIAAVHLVGYVCWGTLDGAARLLRLIGYRRRRRMLRRRHRRPRAALLTASDLGALSQLVQISSDSAERATHAQEALRILVEVICRT
jgi:hypothetical protein